MPEDAELLNGLVETFNSADIETLPDEVLSWAQQAVKLSDTFDSKINLTCIMTRKGYAEDALKILEKLLEDTAKTETAVEDMVNIFAELAAAGYASDASRILAGSESAIVLEPIGIALKMYIGEKVTVAPEIEQIAGDVLKTFTALKEIRNSKNQPKA